MVNHVLALTPEQTQRYRSHIIMPSIGGKGQQKISTTKIVIIGVGGIGCPLLLTLSAAGVGHITIIDHDIVTLDNLQRQIIYRQDDIGQSKALKAAEHIHKLNNTITCQPITEQLQTDNALRLLQGYDIILDTTDTLKTRLLISDAGYFLKTPVISAAAVSYDVLLISLRPYDIHPITNLPFPSLRCLYKHTPALLNTQSCYDYGVLTSVTATAGTLQAHEVLRFITHDTLLYETSLLLIDMRDMRFETFQRHHDKDNPLTGHNASIKPHTIGTNLP